MGNVARVFQQQHSDGPVRSLPGKPKGPAEEDRAWETLAMGALPPLMFQLRFNHGGFTSFAYSDLREVRCRDAGRVELFLQAMRPLRVTIEGRHLRELASCLSVATVRWVQESDPRETGMPEESPQVVRITIEDIDLSS